MPAMTPAPTPVDGRQFKPAGRAIGIWWKRLGAVLAPVAFALVFWSCGSLTPEGRKLAAILAAIAVLWITEVLPLPVSALLGAVLSVALGVADAKTVLAHFADPIVFVFIGGFMIARAMTLHGLDHRVALALLSIPWVGSSPGRTMAGLGVATAVISMWVSNSATTAMMLPIALGILGALHETRVARGLASGPLDSRNWPFATGMMLMVAYGASVGGLGTPVGSPPNLIGIGLIRSATGVEISFFRWMALAVPLLAVMGVLLFLLLYWMHPGDRAPDAVAAGSKAGAGDRPAPTAGGLLDYLRRERAQLGPWTPGQINTLIAFGVAVVLWVTPGILQLPWWEGSGLGASMAARLPESIVALVAAILLFLLPVSLREG